MADWIGTLSYVLLAASYLVTNIYWLRGLAIVALSVEALYFIMVGQGTMWVGIAWVGVFNLINITQLAVLIWRRARVRLSQEEIALHASEFPELDKVDFALLLSKGRFLNVESGTVFMRQGMPVDVIHFIVSGQVHVFVKETLVDVLESPACFGDVSYLTGREATSTMSASGSCRCFRIGFQDLLEVSKANDMIRLATSARFARGLALFVEKIDDILTK